jgi:hypothetical protein
MSTAETPHLTPTQRLHEVTMAALNRPHSEPESSVTISRNAKGDFQFEVTVRGFDATTCQAKATDMIAALRTLYPHSSEQIPEATTEQLLRQTLADEVTPRRRRTKT